MERPCFGTHCWGWVLHETCSKKGSNQEREETLLFQSWRSSFYHRETSPHQVDQASVRAFSPLRTSLRFCSSATLARLGSNLTAEEIPRFLTFHPSLLLSSHSKGRLRFHLAQILLTKYMYARLFHATTDKTQVTDKKHEKGENNSLVLYNRWKKWTPNHRVWVGEVRFLQV